jgi:hypothetical protein
MKKNININLDRETFKKLSIFLSPKEIGEMIHDIYESATNDLKDILFVTEDGVPIKQGDYWYYVVKEKLDAPHRTNTLTYRGNSPTNNVVRFSTEQKAWDYINANRKPLLVTEDGVEIFNKNQSLFWLDWSLGKNGLKKPSISIYPLSFCPINQSSYKSFASKENALAYHKEHLAHFSWDDIEKAYGEIAPLHSPLFVNLVRELKKLE